MYLLAENMFSVNYDLLQGRWHWERGEGSEMLIELLRSWQLPRKKRERSNFIGQAEWRGGGGFTGLAHHSCQSTDHNGNSYFRLDT